MRWMWIDQITHYEPDKRMVAVKNVSLAEEHLHDHFPTQGNKPAIPIMPSSLMIEGMAQTAGILVGSVSQFREKVILAKVGQATFEREVFPGETIQYDATLDRIDSHGASTIGIVRLRSSTETEWTDIGTVNLMFSHIDQNLAGHEFPEENFVFSDNFRTILQTAGLGNLAPS